MRTSPYLLILFLAASNYFFAQYAPPAGEAGTTAVANDSSLIINWANEVISSEIGRQDISDPMSPLVTFGNADNALGYAEGTSTAVISLGDGGSITLGFPYPIKNGESWDFVVFENSFSDTYLEFAHVEVSSDGDRFVRIPSYSAIQTTTQTAGFGNSNATEVHNLAGKYRQGFGTPFDLDDISDSAAIDLNSILYVRIVDVVGSIDPALGSRDSEGNLINDPFTTAFESGGFDLDGVGVIHELNPSASSDQFVQQTLQVYPNPTSGLLFVRGFENVAQLDLFTINGTFITDLPIQSTVNLESLALDFGFYLLAITTEGGDKVIQKISYSN